MNFRHAKCVSEKGWIDGIPRKVLILRYERAVSVTTEPSRSLSSEPGTEAAELNEALNKLQDLGRMLAYCTTTGCSSSGSAQPPQHLRSRRQRLTVLRKAIRHQRIEPGSRGAALAGRRQHLGQYRLRVRPVQCEEGWSHPSAGPHETHHPAAQAAPFAGAHDQAVRLQVR